MQAKIDESETLQSALETKDLQYSEIIAIADKEFADKDYNTARLNYEKALAMDETQAYPSEQLAAIDKILAENQELQNS